MSKRNKKSIFSFVLDFFKNIFVELYFFVHSFFIGVFSLFDIFISTIFTIITSIYYGIAFIIKYIYKFIFSIFSFIWKNFILEIFDMFKSAFLGVYYIIKLVIYDFPKIIMSFIVKIIKKVYDKCKHIFEIISKFFKAIPSKIKKYFVDKFNNSSIVKYYRNKKERELEVLYIDKNSLDAKRSEEKHAYEYLARNREGKLIKGYFMALSKLDTLSYLLDEGFEVYEIKTSKLIDMIHGERLFGIRKMKRKDLIFWLTQLSTYVKSGITLTESVKILAKQNENRAYKKAFDAMIYELTMGESFSEALRKQGNMFPALLVNMVKAAEKIGDIETTLDEMSLYYDEMEKNRKAIIGSLTYPAIILVFAVGVIVLIMAYIIPKFVDVYDNLNVPLNAYTQTIINVSNFLIGNWKIIVIVLFGLIIVLKILYDKVKAFKVGMQYVLMHMPVIGKVIIYNEMTMFSKTFAQLNKNNILLTESIDILSKITNNEIYKMIMFDTISNLLRGDKMSKSFKDNWAVPELAYYMITTGESTGELSQMLERVSDYYQSQQKVLTDQIKAFVEPIMIVFLAVVVGGIVLAIIIPMFEMYQNIR